MSWVIYQESTGRIERLLMNTREEDVPHQLSLGEAYLQAEADDLKDYVADGVLTPRPELFYTVVGHRLTVPPNTEFSVRGPASLEGSTEDGVLEFEFAEPGTYTVTLRLFPYLDAEVTLEG